MARLPRIPLMLALTLAIVVLAGTSLLVQGAERKTPVPQRSAAHQPTPTLVVPTPDPILKTPAQEATPKQYRLPAPVWTLPGSTNPQPATKFNSAPVAPAATTGVVTLLSEDFEGPFPSAGWTLFDNSSDGFERLWNRANNFAFSSGWSAWPAAGGGDALDPALAFYAENLDSWMVYGPLDLHDAAAVELSFQLWRAIEPFFDYVEFLVSLDGVNFVEQTRWDNMADWEPVRFNLNGYSGNSTVWLAWRFYSDGSVTNAGPYVDEIVVTKTVDECVDIGGLFSCPVAATQGWQTTPLVLTQGQLFTVSHSAGLWSVDAVNLPWSGPGGYSPAEDSLILNGCKVDFSQPYATLLGQVGGGAIIPIGAGGTFVADADGPLALRINDSDVCLADNGGVLLLRVRSTNDFGLQINIVGGGGVEVVPAQATYSYGEQISLVAVPDPGWTFLEWSGDLAGSWPSSFLTMDGHKTVTAHFVDQTPPIITWVSPVSGSEEVYHLVCGESATLEVTVGDGSAVDHVRFSRWDAVNLTWVELDLVNSPPYLTTVDACTLNEGWNQIDVVAVDAWGNASSDYFWLSRDDGPISADFVASPLSGSAPLTVTFQNLATGAYTDCLWEHGDGSSDTTCAPLHDYVYTVSGSYTVTLTVSGPSGSATATLADSIRVSEPGVRLGGAAYTVTESNGVATVAVVLTNPATSPVRVEYATSNGTAQAGTDYTAANGTLFFAPGETSKLITLSIFNDSLDEENETLTISLSAPANAVLGPPTSAIVTIADDDPPPEVRLSTPALTVAEDAGPATILVTLSAASAKPVTVNYATSNGSAGAGTDYTATSGTLSFAPGETSKNFTVSILDDNADEPDETVTITLSAPVNATPGTPTTATLTITDNDAPTSPAAQFTATPTAGIAPLTVTFADESNGAVTSWAWNFGDGNSSTAQNPSHVYQNPGTYTVTLTVTGPGGNDREQKAGYIQVTSPPEPDAPVLSIPARLPAVAGSRVVVPVAYQAKSNDISSLLFSINFDEQVLMLDLTDANGDNLPDAIQFSERLPTSVLKTAQVDMADTAGELDLTIADFSATPRVLASGVILTLTLNVLPAAQVGAEAVVDFPITSFGSLNGDITGQPTAGSILIVVPQITLTANPTSVIADGTSTSTITAIVRDSQNKGLANQLVSFATTRGSITGAATTNGNGVATAILTAAASPSQATVTAQVGTTSSSTTVQFIELAPATMTLDAPSARLVADGISTISIVAVVKDQFDQPLAGQTINFATNLGRITSSARTNTAGQATATLTAGTTPGIATVTATSGDVVTTMTIEFLPDTPTLFLPLVSR